MCLQTYASRIEVVDKCIGGDKSRSAALCIYTWTLRVARHPFKSNRKQGVKTMKYVKYLFLFTLFAAFSLSVIGKNIDSSKSPVTLKDGEQIVDMKLLVDREGRLVNVLHEDGRPANVKDPNPDEVTWTGKMTIAMKKGVRGEGDVKGGCVYLSGRCYCW